MPMSNTNAFFISMPPKKCSKFAVPDGKKTCDLLEWSSQCCEGEFVDGRAPYSDGAGIQRQENGTTAEFSTPVSAAGNRTVRKRLAAGRKLALARLDRGRRRRDCGPTRNLGGAR
jgi:hypothetical protein